MTKLLFVLAAWRLIPALVAIAHIPALAMLVLGSESLCSRSNHSALS